jgi:hypothetical protein
MARFPSESGLHCPGRNVVGSDTGGDISMGPSSDICQVNCLCSAKLISMALACSVSSSGV